MLGLQLCFLVELNISVGRPTLQADATPNGIFYCSPNMKTLIYGALASASASRRYKSEKKYLQKLKNRENISVG